MLPGALYGHEVILAMKEGCLNEGSAGFFIAAQDDVVLQVELLRQIKPAPFRSD